MYNSKNYSEQGGDVLHIGGELIFDQGAKFGGGPIPNQAAESPGSDTVAKVRTSLNALLTKLKDAGLMVGDAWSVSVLACPTPAAMPTEETATNSGHATVTIDGTEITITLDCEVKDLAVANHGDTWGKHKWLGFGVRTGLASVAGVKFTDDTGASATLGDSDAAEATALGLSAGDFVLYIKADDPEYLLGAKYFKLWASSYEETEFRMKIVETEAD